MHTTETIRLRYFMDLLMEKAWPVMLVGNAGTGKSVLMGDKLESLSADGYLVQAVPFNFYTTSAVLQGADRVGRLVLRAGTGVRGAGAQPSPGSPGCARPTGLSPAPTFPIVPSHQRLRDLAGSPALCMPPSSGLYPRDRASELAARTPHHSAHKQMPQELTPYPM